MKAAAFIVLALLVDGIPAALSAAFAVIAAFPGTVAGGVAGCLAGNFIGGEIGCAILGFVGGLFGTALDGLAVVTEPVGIILGFVVTFCFSATLGVGLFTLLVLNGLYYPKFMLPSAIAELIPGFNLLPGWTAMVILCLIQKSKEEGGLVGSVASVAGAVTNPSVNSVASAARTVDGIRAPEPQTNAA